MSDQPLKIIGIDVRDFKRLVAVSLTIDPEKGLTTIGGENAAGKSSLLDAVECALAPIPRELKNPLRIGGKGAAIKVTAPPYEIVRWWEGTVPQLRITRADDGSAVQNPAKFLEELRGGVFVDPVGWLQLQPIKQRESLIELTGLDLSALDTQIAEADAERKRLEAEQKRLEAIVSELPEHKDVPPDEQSIADLTAKLQAVMRGNAQAEELRLIASRAKDNLEDVQMAVSKLRRDLKEAEDRMVAAKSACDTAESLAKSVMIQPTDPYELEIQNVETTNRKVRENQARAKARAEWTAAESALGTALENVKVLRADKKKALESVEFPVEGLGFDSTGVTYKDVPLAQASQAERIRVAVGISLAQRGRLAPILVHDASILDAKGLQTLAEEAQKAGAQVFAEIVANRDGDGYDRDCSIYIEEGGIAKV